MPRILYIVPSDYTALKAKGVDGMIFERDEGGFFERVVTVHPAASQNRIIEFNRTFVLHELGIKIFGLPVRNRFFFFLLSPFHLVRVVIHILKLVKSERIDLIRANDPYWTGLTGLIVAKISRRPLCVSVHADFDKRRQLTGGGYSYTFFGMQWPARLACRLVLSSADIVMPIRESLAQWAVSNGASREKIGVIPHGIDINALEAEADHDIRALLNIPSGRHIISFVGRLSPENYVADILEMTRRLAARRNDFCLVIAGGGEMGGWIKAILKSDPILDGLVRLAGFQPRNVCFALRRQSAVSLCLMGGYSLIEACLARRPVISYDVEWHSELVQTGHTGFLVRERDIDDLIRAVEQCFDDPDMSAMFGREAYKLASARHELKMTSQIKRGYYEKLLRYR